LSLEFLQERELGKTHIMKSSLALVGILSTLTSALLAPLPRATNNIAFALGEGISPVPTAAPILPRDIFERATGSGALLGYYAPDNTCGYVSGLLGEFQTPT